MSIPFTKMQGTGNDFVILDALHGKINLAAKDIKKMADRHFGIGFDQLLIIEPSSTADVDFSYRIFNADGSEAEQCGNGLRCLVRYLFDNALTHKQNLKLSCRAGVVEAELDGKELIKVNMGVPMFTPKKIPFSVEKEQLIYTLTLGDVEVRLGVISMGNPHAVICVDDLDTVDVAQVGAAISSHALFPESINVGFMQVTQPYQACLQVYERGSGETLSCGSGACAATVYGQKIGILDREVNIIQPGGELIVSWAGGGNPVFLTGPAETIFKGQWL